MDTKRKNGRKMKKVKKKILFSVITTCLAFSGFANSVSAKNVFITSNIVDEFAVEEGLQNVFKKIDDRGETLETKLLELHFDKTAPENLIDIILPSGDSVSFSKKTKLKKRKGLTILRGKDDYGNKIIVRYRVKNYIGSVSVGDDIYKIIDTDFGNYVIISKMDVENLFNEIDYDPEANVQCPDVIDPLAMIDDCEPGDGGGTGTGGGSSTGRPTTPPSNPYDIRVLFLFANNAALTGSANTVLERSDLAESWIDDMNESLQDTTLEQWGSFSVAAVDTINYNENNRSFSQHNGWVDGNSTVETARRAWGADVVALLVDDSDNNTLAGRANGIYPPSSGANFVMGVNYTFAHIFEHEMGHILGMRHNVEQDNSTSPFSYGHGLRDDSNLFRTIMSYQCIPNCVRSGVFSNPTNDFNGITTGSYSTEDNARVFMNTADNLSSYRSKTAPSVSTWAECRHFNLVSWANPLGTTYSELKVGTSSNIASASLTYSGTGNSYGTNGSGYQYAFVRNCKADECTPWSNGTKTKYSSYCY
jgi:hypothetical protein